MTAGTEQLSGLIADLTSGWTEKREYAVIIKGHEEQRVEAVTHPALLVELFNMTTATVLSVGGDSNSGGHSKPGSRPPGSLDAADLIQSIRQLARTVRQSWSTTRALPRPVAQELRLCLLLSEQADKDDVATFNHELRHLTNRARVLLGYAHAPRSLWGKCGCGGSLNVYTDDEGLPEKIKCVGTRENLPCGAESPRSGWLELLHQLEEDQDEHDDH